MDITTEDTGRMAITGEPDPAPARSAIEFVVHPPLVNVRILRTDGGKICGVAQIQTQRGPLTFVASADEKLIRDVLARVVALRMKRGLLPTAHVGAFGDWVKDMSGKIAQARVVSNLLEQAKSVASHPQVARAVGLSTVVIPGAGSAVLALQNATELLQRLKHRDPKAILAWRQLVAQSRFGNHKARKSVHVVHLVARAPRIVSRH